METVLHPLSSDEERPRQFTFPFCYEPHPLCRLAAQEVQRYIASTPEVKEDADCGKMFGVLVVERADGSLAFLAAYSGLLAGRNDWPWFVPSVYDAQQPDGHFKQTERRISGMNAQIASLPAGDPLAVRLRVERKQQSEDLQRWLFDQYQLLDARGVRKNLVQIWQDYHTERVRQRFPLPPGGAGDCCAPKLLQYAYREGLRPLCMAEFWWGRSPKQEIRHHLHYYPACQGKCKPILTHMLRGLDVAPDPSLAASAAATLDVCYEDSAVAVVRKPSGMLSVPGKSGQPSVLSLMLRRCPSAMLPHRLDMATSGLLVVAKTREAYHDLQRQFLEREVHKRYVALLEGRPPVLTGVVSLPLRPDPLDRPRQVVDAVEGKDAVTRYEWLGGGRVALWPLTGRTHQLRVHCAHPDGLGCPIRGDELYGTKADRLYLHAEELSFRHPETGRTVQFRWEAPF